MTRFVAAAIGANERPSASAGLVDPRAGMQRFFIVDRFQLLGWSFLLKVKQKYASKDYH